MTDLAHSILVTGPTKISIVSMVDLVTPVIEDREVAWAGAKAMMKIREDRGYLMGRFLGTGFANTNGHIFDLQQVTDRHPDIVHTPLNVLHNATHIIGNYMATELVKPDAAMTDTLRAMAAAQASRLGILDVRDALGGPTDGLANPYVEALAAVHRYAMPMEWQACMAAHAAGQLFFSMEAVPDKVICPTCATTAPYTGPQSSDYCDHMNASRGPKQLDKPLFVGGAAVIPPGRPGWRDANVTEFATLLDTYEDEAERVYAQIVTSHSHFDDREATKLTAALLGGVFTDRPEARTIVAPLWDRMAPGLADVDMVPPENVRSAVTTALSMVDRASTPTIKLARAEAVTRGVPQSPFALRLMAAATEADLVLAGGNTGQEWARDTLAKVDQVSMEATIRLEALLTEVTDGAMIALVPTDTDAAKVTLPNVNGALPPGEQHLTLRYLGKAANLDTNDLTIAGQALRSAAARLTGPIEGVIAGSGELGTGGAIVLYLNIDVDCLVDEIHWDIDERPKYAYDPGSDKPIELPATHFAEPVPNFIAHLTVGYPIGDADRTTMLDFARNLNGQTVTFDRIALVVGGQVNVISLVNPGTPGTAVPPPDGPYDTLALDIDLMLSLLDIELETDITQAERKTLAESGVAMPDGSYYIRNAKELKAAISLVGKSKTYTTAQVKAHIKTRADALGLTAQLPDDWK